MRGRTCVRACVSALALLVVIPAVAWAQGIAGVVRDTSGAVLPGVTVEASSPALIEQVRTVVTDGQGLYDIVSLRPGTYTVTFTLPGFNVVKREGIELTTNFTASVNIELQVGALEETITVSGASPVVDIRNVVGRREVSDEIIAALPTARMHESLATLIPGVTMVGRSRPTGQDVGGLAGYNPRVLIHGSTPNDMWAVLDGLPYADTTVGGAGNVYLVVAGEAQEYTWEAGPISVESSRGGILINTIPKEGGNRFGGSVFGDITTTGMQNNNLTKDLIAQGLTAVNHTHVIWDLNPVAGGPIVRDKLWFFSAYRFWGAYEYVAGMWYAKDPLKIFTTPDDYFDYSRQADNQQWSKALTTRLTWAPNNKNKFGLYGASEVREDRFRSITSLITPEAASEGRFPRVFLFQATWKSPVTNKLLLEVGFAPSRYKYTGDPQLWNPANALNLPGIRDSSNGLTYRASLTNGQTRTYLNGTRVAMSYVTGAHAFKVGTDLATSRRFNDQRANSNMSFTVANGVPRSVTLYGTPYSSESHMNAMLGLFAQDQWKLSRLTLTLGLRYDHLDASVPAQRIPATQFAPARDYAEVPDVPNWHDLSPRVGAAFDLFGTGKTALKVSFGRYLYGVTNDFAVVNDPLLTSVASIARTWNDTFYPVGDPRRGNFAPDCNFSDNAANGECGVSPNNNFGTTTLAVDDALKRGWNVRQDNREITANLQHELRSNVSMNVGYYRRWTGKYQVTQNRAYVPANYDSFCITAPTDPRLPNGGGYEICGLYDLNLATTTSGKVDNFLTAAGTFGDQWAHYNGVDISLNARFSGGMFLQGGINTGRNETNFCGAALGLPQVTFIGPSGATVIEPRTEAFCDIKPPFQTQVKLSGNYPLPWWGLQVSATLQSLPGVQVLANRTYTSAELLPFLKRNLASGANGTLNIDLIPPGTVFEGRSNQVDLRMGKNFRNGRSNLRVSLDLYNALNVSTVLQRNTNFGVAYNQPSYILPGRMYKVSVLWDF